MVRLLRVCSMASNDTSGYKACFPITPEKELPADLQPDRGGDQQWKIEGHFSLAIVSGGGLHFHPRLQWQAKSYVSLVPGDNSPLQEAWAALPGPTWGAISRPCFLSLLILFILGRVSSFSLRLPLATSTLFLFPFLWPTFSSSSGMECSTLLPVSPVIFCCHIFLQTHFFDLLSWACFATIWGFHRELGTADLPWHTGSRAAPHPSLSLIPALIYLCPSVTGPSVCTVLSVTFPTCEALWSLLWIQPWHWSNTTSSWKPFLILLIQWGCSLVSLHRALCPAVSSTCVSCCLVLQFFRSV